MSDLRTELLAVRAEYGALTPSAVVDAARPEGHPLHSRFEWDDTVAAEAHRRQQARQLIAMVVRDVRRPNGKASSIREFHSVRGDGPDPVYEPLDDIVADPVMTAVLLATMKREWLTLKRRYDRFAEFHQMILEDLGVERAA